MQKGHIDDVERAVTQSLKDTPRVIVEAGPGVPPAVVGGLNEWLAGTGKLQVVAGAEERKALDALRRTQSSAQYDEKLQCELGREVPPSAMLRASKMAQSKDGFLTIGLYDLQSGCQLQSASAAWEADARHMTQEAVSKLLGKLKQEHLQMPGATAQTRKAPKSDEVKQGDAGNWTPSDDETVLVQFASQPSGAAVELDGRGVCTTPCKQAVGGGEHRIRMGKAKFASREESVVLQAGSRVNWTLEATTGTVIVDVGVAGLPIRIDGEIAGLTPLTAELDEGRHRLELASPCYAEASIEFSLPRAQRKTLPLQAVARLSAVRVEAKDSEGSAVEGEVWVDASRAGPTWKAVTVPLCSKNASVRVGGVEVWRAAVTLKEREVLKLGALVGTGAAAKRDGGPRPSCRPGDATECALACEGGDASSCMRLGDMYRDGKGVSQDLDRAVRLLRAACDGGNAEGCSDLGGMYEKGRGVPKDEVRSFDLQRQACNDGYDDACIKLGWKYANGIGVGKDVAKAVAAYSKACDMGLYFGCTELGFWHTDGTFGVPRDANKALTFYGKSCGSGDGKACNNLGVMYGDAKGIPADFAKAAALYEKSCALKFPAACVNLAMAYRNGKGVPTDLTRAAELLRKACDDGIANACDRLKEL